MTREEAIKEAYGIPVTKAQHEALQFLIPELRESEDERIRKNILALVKKHAVNHERCMMEEYLEKLKERGHLTKEEEYTLQRIIEYLEDETCPSEWISLLHDIYCLPYEKQKEQKPAEWDDYTKTNLSRAIQIIKNAKGNLQGYQTDDGIYECDKAIECLEHFLYRGLKIEKLAEWSEEDEEMIQSLILEIGKYEFFAGIESKKIINFLKSLHPSWKPSEEQMETLERWLLDNEFKGDSRYVYPIFESLYEQLKAL